MQRPGFFSGIGGALAGFAIGGLLGSLLFGGFGGGMGGGMGGGIGMFDILLIGGGLFLLFYFLRRRRAAEEPAYATAGASRYGTAANTGAGGTAVMEAPAGQRGDGDLETGLGHIRQMDPGFDPDALSMWARTFFASVQSATAMRDMGMLRDRLAPQIYTVLQGQCDELRGSRRTNYVEKVDLQRAEVTEAWQETGQDFVTVYFVGSMLDYTVSDGSGEVVEGSKTDPQSVEEFWTFTRPVGPNKWKLTAIQAA